MTGITKRIYLHDLRDIDSMWNKCLKEIENVLPKNYTKEDVIRILKKYFPYEWESVEHKKRYYDAKDRNILLHKGKKRYSMEDAYILIQKNTKFKKIISHKHIEKYNKDFSENVRNKNEELLEIVRIPKIEKIKKKIRISKLYTQSVTPDFIDKLIGLYERKNTSHKDKVYIITELKKYYNDKVINFFFKLNDTEINIQLRDIAFYHLQKFNFHPRKRKQKYMIIHTRNKKRKNFLKNEYAYMKFKIPQTPEELEYRIFSGKEQTVKKYDYFLSHSSKDSLIVMRLKEYLNNSDKFIFCDWINDSDYLKRELMSLSTLRVIEHRLNKSKEMIFVKTENSLNSLWCEYELNYFHESGKKILFIDEDNINNNVFAFSEYPKENYLNKNYKKLLFDNSKASK